MTKPRQSAAGYAMDLYARRSPDSFVCAPILESMKSAKKRHLLRFIAFAEEPGCEIRPIADLSDTGLAVVEQLCTLDGEWWGYITSDKAVCTPSVCRLLHAKLGAPPGRFFTDVMPWSRSEIKRYEFTRLQHFRLLMSRLPRQSFE